MTSQKRIKRDYFEWTERQWKTPDGRVVPYKTADISELFWDVIPFFFRYQDPIMSVGLTKWPTKYSFKLRWKITYERGFASLRKDQAIYWTIGTIGNLSYLEYHTQFDQFLPIYLRKLDLYLIPPILNENLSQQTRREQILELYEESVSRKIMYYQDWDMNAWPGEEPF